MHVTAEAWDAPFDLLVPFSSSARIQDLLEEVAKRVKKYGTRSISDDATFVARLISVTGPVLDMDDKLAETVLAGEIVVLIMSDPTTIMQSPISTTLTFKVLTAAAAKEQASLETTLIKLNYEQSVQDLHDAIVRLLHIPDALRPNHSLVDMHTQEMPIHNSAYPQSLKSTGLADLAESDGSIKIFVVVRTSIFEKSSVPIGSGMSDVYRVQDHWQPSKAQSKRGIAMLLSTLRVFTTLARQHKLGNKYQSAVLDVFARLCSFLPAVRSLYILVEGRKPYANECAALSSAVHAVLQNMIPANLIGDNKSRYFEGARLLFGFISEKARHIAQTDTQSDFSHWIAQEGKEPIEDATRKARQLALFGGQGQDTVTFSGNIPICDNLTSVELFSELQDLNHVMGLSGQLGLVVVRGTALTSVVAPCLTFDEAGLLAVYTGRVACAAPGADIGLFRPHYGDSTPNITLSEQMLAPILQRYATEGTDIFDVLGTPQARQMEQPDEIVMFCIDCSQSMHSASDFILEDEEETMTSDRTRLINVDAFVRSTLDSAKAALLKSEGFEDVLAAIREAHLRDRRTVATTMLQLISQLVLEDLERMASKHERLENHRVASRQRLTLNAHEPLKLSRDIKDFEELAAGLRIHEIELIDFLLFRAESTSASSTWEWHVGDPVPSTLCAKTRSFSDPSITDIPLDLRCPVSYEALQDPVIAADGHTYSLQAISRWFAIRKSSPLTGLGVKTTDLRPNNEKANEVSNWIKAEDLIGPLLRLSICSSPTITITFTGPYSVFSRSVPHSLNARELYKLAFRGMWGRHAYFQLKLGHSSISSCPSYDIKSLGIQNNTNIEICILENTPAIQSQQQFCLIKVFQASNHIAFGFWLPRINGYTLRTVIIKYWRFKLKLFPNVTVQSQTFRGNLVLGGDNWSIGPQFDTNESLVKVFSKITIRGSLQQESIFLDSSTASECSKEKSPEVFKLLVTTPERERTKRMSRLDVLKQMFEALVNRMIAYSYSTHIGLVTVSSEARLTQALTHLIENFRNSVEGLHARGDTALWDGVLLAKNNISEYAAKFPRAKKRIICLSDGADTKSSQSAEDVYNQLRESGIVLDSICIGSDLNAPLKAISHLLGSYCFRPENMESALAICEMEPMLSITERPPIAPPRTFAYETVRSATYAARYTGASLDDFPPRKQHQRMNDEVVELSNMVATQSSARLSASRSNIRTSRIMAEIKKIAQAPNTMYDCYVSETDMSFWKIVMSGPSETPYASGTFLMYLEMPDNYQAFPPKGRFITPVLHPNINRHGRICHSIFDRDWTSDTSLSSVLNTVYGLLFQADYSDPVHTTATLRYHLDQVEFDREIKNYVHKHATKSRLAWRATLLGEPPAYNGSY